MSALSERYFSVHPYSDAETGCRTIDEAAFQACRQAYFLKQQNQFTLQQASDTTETQSQIDQLKSELNALKTHSATPAGIVLTGRSLAGLVLLFTLVIVLTAFITKRALRK